MVKRNAKAAKRKHTTVSIPIALYEKINSLITETGFASVSEWVTYVLRDVLMSMEEKEKPVMSKEEEEKIKKRLRALGYL